MAGPHELDVPAQVLARPATDLELKMGSRLLCVLMEEFKGITDDQGEIALAVALALYVKHRELISDRHAMRRIIEHVTAVTPHLPPLATALDRAKALDLDLLRRQGKL